MDERTMWQSNVLKINVFLCVGLILAACQSHPQQGKVTPNNKTSQERPLKVIKSTDGVQDITWQIKKIGAQNARFYAQTPSLKFNSQLNVLQGHTGCNEIRGRYVIDNTQKRLNLEAKAGYNSCDQALAQEAELAEALASVRRYQVNNQQLVLLDERGRTLIIAQKP